MAVGSYTLPPEIGEYHNIAMKNVLNLIDLYNIFDSSTIKVWAIDGHGKSKQMLVRTLSGHAHRINTLALNCDYILRTGWFVLGDNLKPEMSRLTVAEKQQKAQERFLFSAFFFSIPSPPYMSCI